MSKKFEVVASHMANCIRLAGNTHATAGLLLYRIYCRSKNSRMKDSSGEAGWVVLTPQEWEMDTGLSIPQYNRALKKLKEDELIIWKNAPRGKQGGAYPLWAKISDEIKEIIQSPQLRTRNWSNSAGATGGGETNSAGATLIYKGVNNKHVKVDCNSDESEVEENESESKDSRREDNIINLKEAKKMKKGKRGIKTKPPKTVEEIKQEHENKEWRNTITHVTEFGFFWKEGLREVYGEDIELVDWSYKERQFAKSILDKLDKSKMDRASTMKTLIRNWDDYAGFSSTQRGLDKAPMYPSIGYVSAQFQDLIYWLESFNEDSLHSSAKDSDVPSKRRSISDLYQEDCED